GGGVTVRDASVAWLGAPAGSLFRVEWTPVRGPAGPAPVGRWAMLGTGDERLLPAGFAPHAYGAPAGVDAVLLPCPPTCPPTGVEGPKTVHATAASVLNRLQDWLAHSSDSRPPLVVLTRGAGDFGEEPVDLA